MILDEMPLLEWHLHNFNPFVMCRNFHSYPFYRSSGLPSFQKETSYAGMILYLNKVLLVNNAQIQMGGTGGPDRENREDPDQTASSEATWSESALFV